MSTSAQQVPDPEVSAKPTSRTYTAAYKSWILAEYDGLGKVAKAPVQIRRSLRSDLVPAGGQKAPLG
jgi:transposase